MPLSGSDHHRVDLAPRRHDVAVSEADEQAPPGSRRIDEEEDRPPVYVTVVGQEQGKPREWLHPIHEGIAGPCACALTTGARAIVPAGQCRSRSLERLSLLSEICGRE
jgi:hypothetical protein